MGRSGSALFVAVLLSASASAETERPCPACEHGMARVEGGVSGAADYLCRFCEVLVHVRPDGREAVSIRIAGERREFDLVGGARLLFPLPGFETPEEVLVPVQDAALAAAAGAGHPVRLPGHAVVLPGHPVRLPGAPVNLPSHPVRLPGHPVELPAAPVELPASPIELPGPPVELPSHPVRLMGRPVGLPGHPVGLPGHPVRRAGHPVAFAGEVVITTKPAEPVGAAPVAAPRAAPVAAAAAPRLRGPERAGLFGRRDAEAGGTVPACPPSSARTSSSFSLPRSRSREGRSGSSSS